MHSQLVNGRTLLEILFQKDSRPSPRWLMRMTKARAIPSIIIGRRRFYDPDKVRAALDRHYTIKAA